MHVIKNELLTNIALLGKENARHFVSGIYFSICPLSAAMPFSHCREKNVIFGAIVLHT